MSKVIVIITADIMITVVGGVVMGKYFHVSSVRNYKARISKKSTETKKDINAKVCASVHAHKMHAWVFG